MKSKQSCTITNTVGVLHWRPSSGLYVRGRVLTPRPPRSGGRDEPQTEGYTDGQMDPVVGHPQGPLVLGAHGAVHLGSDGVGLGRQSQERPGERPQLAR